MAEMKVHLYQVVAMNIAEPFIDVLREAGESTTQKRLRKVGNQELRLENIQQPSSSENQTPYWLMDFIKFRFDHGPGKASRSNPIQGFNLKKDEGFGEETAALYDPQSGYILIQYNHAGMRASTIQEYFSLFNHAHPKNYEFRMKIDDSSEARLAQKKILTKIEFKIAPSRMNVNQRSSGMGLLQALDLSDSMNGQTIQVTVSSGRNGELKPGIVKQMINGLKELTSTGDENNPIVEKFEVFGKTAQGDRAEAIDMLAPKVEQNIDGIVIGNDRRYTLESRWSALVRAHNGWRDLIRG